MVQPQVPVIDLSLSDRGQEHAPLFLQKRPPKFTVKQMVEKRLKLGLTQREVAERMGVPASVVSRLEREGSNPRLSTVVRYCVALGCQLVVSVGKMDGVELFVARHTKS